MCSVGVIAVFIKSLESTLEIQVFEPVFPTSLPDVGSLERLPLMLSPLIEKYQELTKEA